MAGLRLPYRCMAAAPFFALGMHGEALAAKGGDGQHAGPSAELDVSLEYASSYVFRGLNLFRDRDQDEHEGVLLPHLSWSAPGGNFSLGYSAAYQLNGDNIQENVHAGVGRAQVLFVDYGFRLSPDWLFTPEAAVIAYPWASPAQWFSEVSTELKTQIFFDVALNVGYLFAVRPRPSATDQLYLSLRTSKSAQLSKDLSFDFGVSAGVKLLRPHESSKDNEFDVLVSEGFSYSLSDAAYIGISFACAWTNLGARHDLDTGATVRPGFVDELVPFWSLVIGAQVSGSEKLVPRTDFSRRRSVE
jgi:hypothetical protein